MKFSYRHIAVRKEDHCLQCVEFGGKIFVEVMLTFGGGNSPFKFNMPSSFLITLACLDSGMDPRQSVQQLDDNCVCDSKGSWFLRRYWNCYRKIAEEIGVSLAGEENPSKAFGPSIQGEILGLMYNSVDWTWWIPKDKSDRLIMELKEVFEEGKAENQELMKIAGKVQHYHRLVGGKFERSLIIHSIKNEKPKKAEVFLDKETRKQMLWWILNLQALSYEGNRIMDPLDFFPSRALVLYSDAAGGATKNGMKGWGICNLEKKEWDRDKWPKYIIENYENRGRKWGRKLTLLEGYAALKALVTWGKEAQEANGAALMVDNIGFMYSTRNGSSHDQFVYTIAKCVHDVATGLGIRAKVYHTSRRSDKGEEVSDHLSKNEIKEMERIWPEGQRIKGKGSVLERWIKEPRIMTDLGRRVLMEISTKTVVNMGRDYNLDYMERTGNS